MEIDKKLLEDIKNYCELNNLKPNKFVNDLLRKAFMVEKYGEAPPFVKKPKPIQQEITETSEKEIKTYETVITETKKEEEKDEIPQKNDIFVEKKPKRAPMSSVKHKL